MNIKQLTRRMEHLQKFFVDYEGTIYATEDLHEKLAREICEKNHWVWSNSGFYSCGDYLLAKGFVKFSNYSVLRYVAVSKKYINDKKVMDNAMYLADLFNLKLEVY